MSVGTVRYVLGLHPSRRCASAPAGRGRRPWARVVPRRSSSLLLRSPTQAPRSHSSSREECPGSLRWLKSSCLPPSQALRMLKGHRINENISFHFCKITQLLLLCYNFVWSHNKTKNSWWEDASRWGVWQLANATITCPSFRRLHWLNCLMLLADLPLQLSIN